jgi:subtilisin family serine protease
MDKIVPDLLRKYRNRVVYPVIVEAKRDAFDKVRAQLKATVPINLLEAKFNTFLPRIMPLIEFPLSKWKELKAFNMVATVLTPDLIEEVAQWREVQKIYPDYLKWALQTVPLEGIFKDYRDKPFTSTYWTKRMLGLDRAKYTGRGITTAVIDTGARVTHEQLKRIRILTAIPEKGGSGDDSNGHGTHCASTVGGSYAIDRRYKAPVEGMAPGCTLISIQALGFIIGMGTTSDVLEAMEMSIGLGAKVVSMSLGSDDAPKDEDNPEAKAVNKLVEAGILPVIAGGNSGPEPSTVGSPGSCLNSLTVGAWDEIKGEVADFSSRGPTKGDGYIKPDIVAPGVRINSALVGLLDQMTDPTQPRYGPISGTSMACPHAAGLVTCMAQLYRERIGKELTVEEIKTMMKALGHEKNNDDGWGLLRWDIVESWASTTYGVPARAQNLTIRSATLVNPRDWVSRYRLRSRG